MKKQVKQVKLTTKTLSDREREFMTQLQRQIANLHDDLILFMESERAAEVADGRLWAAAEKIGEAWEILFDAVRKR